MTTTEYDKVRRSYTDLSVEAFKQKANSLSAALLRVDRFTAKIEPVRMQYPERLYIFNQVFCRSIKNCVDKRLHSRRHGRHLNYQYRICTFRSTCSFQTYERQEGRTPV